MLPEALREKNGSITPVLDIMHQAIGFRESPSCLTISAGFDFPLNSTVVYPTKEIKDRLVAESSFPRAGGYFNNERGVIHTFPREYHNLLLEAFEQLEIGITFRSIR